MKRIVRERKKFCNINGRRGHEAGRTITRRAGPIKQVDVRDERLPRVEWRMTAEEKKTRP